MPPIVDPPRRCGLVARLERSLRPDREFESFDASSSNSPVAGDITMAAAGLRRSWAGGSSRARILAMQSPSGEWNVRAVSGGGLWDARTEMARATKEVWRALSSPSAVVVHPATCPSLQKAAEFARLPAAIAIRVETWSRLRARSCWGRASTPLPLRTAWAPHATILGNAIRIWSSAQRGAGRRRLGQIN